MKLSVYLFNKGVRSPASESPKMTLAELRQSLVNDGHFTTLDDVPDSNTGHALAQASINGLPMAQACVRKNKQCAKWHQSRTLRL